MQGNACLALVAIVKPTPKSAAQMVSVGVIGLIKGAMEAHLPLMAPGGMLWHNPNVPICSPSCLPNNHHLPASPNPSLNMAESRLSSQGPDAHGRSLEDSERSADALALELLDEGGDLQRAHRP